MPRTFLLLAALAPVLAACGTATISPNYAATGPNLRVGSERPDDVEDEIENAGSFCLQVDERWHKDGKAPDGKALWTKDTFRKVVPCP
jgi:hypothetical protein